MAVKIILLCVVFMGTTATHVELTSSWEPELGFVTECSWKLFSNDSLQSVRLYNNVQQFMIYRPERDGKQRAQIYPLNGNFLEVDCKEDDARGLSGRCVMKLELRQPPTSDITYRCEVSGERPMFRTEEKTIDVSAFVAPTDAEINVVKTSGQSSQLVLLNCTSTGLPAPNLSWTVGDRMVPHDFAGSVWNSTSKLWHVWSLFSYTPTQLEATCTPEVSKSGQTERAHSAMYSSASGIVGFPGLAAVLLLTLFTR